MFAIKLNLLMEKTDTCNSDLAHAISIDPSYLSRLRRGKRNLPKNPTFLLPMSIYFSKLLEKNHVLKENLLEILYTSSSKIDINNNLGLHEIIYNWFNEKSCVNSQALNCINNQIFINTSFNNTKSTDNQHVEDNKSKKMLFYGKKGIQRAVLKMLREVKQSDKIITFLLFSDFDMSWAYEDEFKDIFFPMVNELLEKGNRLKIIHSNNRNLNDLAKYIFIWIPVHLIDKIELFYYPKLQETIFKRTLFIAPSISAISTNSLDDIMKDEDILNIYITDKEALYSLEKEFNLFLSLCKKVFLKYNYKDKDVLWLKYSDILKEKKILLQ